MKKYVFALMGVAALGAGFVAVTSNADDVPKPYLDIQEIKTPAGLTIWHVYDQTIPAFSLRFGVDGGANLDPVGQEGVSELLSTLLDEGAGDRDAEAFQNAMDQYGVKISFSAGRDQFYGNLTTTVQYQDMGVGLFVDALNKPHFADDAVARMKDALLSSLRFSQMNPQWVAGQELFNTLFDGQAYARPVEGTENTLQSLTSAKVAAHRQNMFCKDGLKIAVVGDIKSDDISRVVDQVFGQWPACRTVVKTEKMTFKNTGRTVQIDRQGAQSVVVMAQRAISRQDKDWWAVRILDFALGGGQFSSRLMDEVRVKRGLTYGVSTGVAAYDYAPIWMIQGGVAPENAEKAIDLIKSIWADVATNGLTDTEIKAAKDYLIGSLPLALTSTGQIASIVLQLQEDGLPKDTLDRRKAEIDAVTVDDIRRVAKELLHADQLVTVIVGPEMKEAKK